MYAVIGTGGKQYKVAEGQTIRVEKLAGELGAEIFFDKVFLFCDGEKVTVGQPRVAEVAVRGHVVEQGRAKKIIVFKYKRRKRFRRKAGHRQAYTAVRIDGIEGMAE